MPEYLDNGAVTFNFGEMLVLDGFVKKVEVLKNQYQQLKNQLEKLEGINTYLALCRDGFEAENKILRKQLEVDQFSQICKIDNQLKTTSRWL